MGNQKIIELEALNAGLETDLDLLQSSVQCLQADVQAKDDLISDLMSSTSRAENGPSSTASASRPRRDSMLDQLWNLSGLKDESKVQLENDELKRMAEEAMLDNMRLHNDLRG